MKKYERKINYKSDDINITSFKCPEKFSLEKINEYAKADKLEFKNEELKEIQDITYSICEVLYMNWVRERKRKGETENDKINTDYEESNNLYPSEYGRTSREGLFISTPRREAA